MITISKNSLSTGGSDWWKKAVFYQVYPRSFNDSSGNGIGDLQGIIEKLDYLNDGTANSLGIDAIWFSPFYVSPDHDFGYDVADYCDIDPRYGTLADFDRLVREAHSRGIRVMLDLVVNHTSDRHQWFRESRSSRQNHRRDWYIWRDGRGRKNSPPNNWKNHFFGPAWTFDEATGQYYLHSFLPQQPDLNWFNPAVREAVYGAVLFWLERGADGFRLDVPHVYCKDEMFRNNPPFFLRPRARGGMPWRDRSPVMNIFNLFGLPDLQYKKYTRHHPETHRILRELRKILDSYPAKTSVGEIISEDPAQVAAYYGVENDELHMNFYFDLAHCRWKAGAFRRCVERWERLLPGDAWPAYAFSNHDLVRAISRYDRDGRGDKRARLLAMMLLTLRGTPFIYYGEEIGMKDPFLPRQMLKDPVGIKWYPFHRGRDGARTPMQWDNSKPYAGFTVGKPWLPVGPEPKKRTVTVQLKDPGSLLSFYRNMIRLRRELPALNEGSYHSITGRVPRDCFVYRREHDNENILIALNFSTAVRRITPIAPGREYRILISTDPWRKLGDSDGPLYLGPLEGCIIR